MQFIVQNNFLFERKTKSYGRGGVHFYETRHVDGEPGSAGHWTKENYDDAMKQFMVIFKK
jgi:hypothetical protein